MQLVWPSLAAALVTLVLMVAVIPRLSPPLIAGLAAALLAVVLVTHVRTFRSDYTNATWPDTLRAYAPAVLLGAAALAAIVYYSARGPSAAVEAAPAPTFSAASLVGGGRRRR
jgi:hypothetical protein